MKVRYNLKVHFSDPSFDFQKLLLVLWLAERLHPRLYAIYIIPSHLRGYVWWVITYVIPWCVIFPCGNGRGKREEGGGHQRDVGAASWDSCVCGFCILPPPILLLLCQGELTGYQYTDRQHSLSPYYSFINSKSHEGHAGKLDYSKIVDTIESVLLELNICYCLDMVGYYWIVWLGWIWI